VAPNGGRTHLRRRYAAYRGANGSHEGKKWRKKLAFQPLLQIHHHEGHQDRRLGGNIQLAQDPAQVEAPLALSELAFDRYPVKFVLAGLLFDFLLLFSIGRRPPQRRP
jgi:hypothetical protein